MNFYDLCKYVFKCIRFKVHLRYLTYELQKKTSKIEERKNIKIKNTHVFLILRKKPTEKTGKRKR